MYNYRTRHARSVLETNASTELNRPLLAIPFCILAHQNLGCYVRNFGPQKLGRLYETITLRFKMLYDTGKT